MSKSVPSSSLRVFADKEGVETEIDLSGVDPASFFGKDIVRRKLTGVFPVGPNFKITNFAESVLIDISASFVDFSECDFKDTLTKHGTFVSCKFDNGTFATAFFWRCEFDRCTFYNFAIHGSEFRGVRFIGCDLTNLLVKASKFFECEFVDCKTSNRIFEGSTLDSTTFKRTNVQIQTITGNFGLVASALEDSWIRTARIREEHELLEPSEMSRLLDSPDLSAIEKLRIEYFLDQDMTRGSDSLDQAVDVSRWARLYNNPGSFVELLESFSGFLNYLYEQDKVTAHAILLLHKVTSKFTKEIPTSEGYHRMAVSLGGVHLVLSRAVEEYLFTLDQQVPSTLEPLTFLVNGPLDANVYREELDRWLNDGSMDITKLIEHNSPVELELTPATMGAVTSFIALFLATRTKTELERIRRRRPHPSRASTGEEVRARRDESALVVSRQHVEQIQIRSLLPGSLLEDLKLDVSTKKTGRLRSMFVERLVS